MARILGIDPGLGTTGYGLLRFGPHGRELVEAGVVTSTASRTLERRLLQLHEGLQELIASLEPDAMAVEALYTHYERPQTAILMGHARGVICLAAAQAGIPLHGYSATQIKRILTGNGRAGKPQVQAAVVAELGLAAPLEPPDVADALAVAICHQALAEGVRRT